MKLSSTSTTYQLADAACSESQLVILLLDAAIRYVRESADQLRAGRWHEKGCAVDAALLCLRELRQGLDLKRGGDAATKVDQMYDFLATKITIGNMQKDPLQFDQVATSLVTLRQAWTELFSRLKQTDEKAAPAAALA